MWFRRWFRVLAILVFLPAGLCRAQLLSDPGSLRHIYQEQAREAEALSTAWREAAFRLLEVARQIEALPPGPGPEKTRWLAEAQSISQGMTSLRENAEETAAMARETGNRILPFLEARLDSLRMVRAGATTGERPTLEEEIRELEEELAWLRGGERGPAATGLLQDERETLSYLARVAAREHQRLYRLRGLQEELRLYLGDLRLMDETSMPPSARSGGGGDQDPGCPPVSCGVTGASPADVPFSHVQPGEGAADLAGTTVSPTSLARLHQQMVARTADPGLSEPLLAEDDRIVNREVGMVGEVTAFRDDLDASPGAGPKVIATGVFSRPLGDRTGLVVEPFLAGRTLRNGSSFFIEMAAELRETLTGTALDGRWLWQVTAWQKGRYRSEALPPPGYLEPGRLEGGAMGHLTLPLNPGWSLHGEGGVDAVRYGPEEWQVLDRQGVSGALGAGWRGGTTSATLLGRASHHRFSTPSMEWGKSRQDTRIGGEASVSLERAFLLRLSVGGAWNQSGLEAYEFRSLRAALVLSAPWGKGSVQGYAALAHQDYLNPGPEDARVAPSDQDSGSIVSVQYTRPLKGSRLLKVRAGWSRSQTGFRDDFYERFGIGLGLYFRSG